MRRILVICGLFLGFCGLALGQAVPRDPTSGNVAGTPVIGIFSGADTSSQAATLPADATRSTWICGFSVSGLGATSATNVSVTVGSLVGAKTLTYSYSFAAGATVLNTPLIVHLSMCLPGNAVNTAITVTVPGAAGNTATQINAWGYVL